VVGTVIIWAPFSVSRRAISWNYLDGPEGVDQYYHSYIHPLDRELPTVLNGLLREIRESRRQRFASGDRLRHECNPAAIFLPVMRHDALRF
jgi:hypothetical protein